MFDIEFQRRSFGLPYADPLSLSLSLSLSLCPRSAPDHSLWCSRSLVDTLVAVAEIRRDFNKRSRLISPVLYRGGVLPPAVLLPVYSESSSVPRCVPIPPTGGHTVVVVVSARGASVALPSVSCRNKSGAMRFLVGSIDLATRPHAPVGRLAVRLYRRPPAAQPCLSRVAGRQSSRRSRDDIGDPDVNRKTSHVVVLGDTYRPSRRIVNNVYNSIRSCIYFFCLFVHYSLAIPRWII